MGSSGSGDTSEDEAEPQLSDSDEEIGDGGQLVDVSEGTRKLLTKWCTRSASHEQRKSTRVRYKLPRVPPTRTPKVDHVMRALAPPAATSTDRDLARIQTFVLDSLAPVTSLLERAERMSVEDIKDAAFTAGMLIGNANVHISQLRREKYITTTNKNLTPLIKESADFAAVAPNLFGSDFSKRAKEHLEQVESLRQKPQCSNSRGDREYRGNYKKPFFRKLRLPLRELRVRELRLPLGEGKSQRKGQSIPLQGREGQAPPPLDKTVIVNKTVPHVLTVTNQNAISLFTLKSMGIVALAGHTSPAGRLANFVANWERITKDRWVLNTVKGYQIEFISQPHQSRRPHPCRFSEPQQELVEWEIAELSRKGAVTKLGLVPRDGFLSTLFLVPKKDGGQRPVVNLKNLNSFVEVPHFKMEGIHILKSLVARGDWLVKIDLKDAYFSIPIDQAGTQEIPVLPVRRTDLPIQLPPIWANVSIVGLLKPAMALGRELGMRLVVYIDDILLMAETKDKAREQADGLIFLLQCLGYTINIEKTVKEPSQTIPFLGFTLDTRSMELSLPAEKIKKIRAESRRLLEAERITGRALSRLIGKMNAANQVIPPAPLFYRHLQMDLAAALRISGQDYETILSLLPESKEEKDWWDTEMVKWNGKTVLSTEPDMVIESDASNLGWGASCQDTSTGGSWSEEESPWHINCLELLAATLALKTFAKSKRGLSILLKTDSSTVVAYINNQGGTVSKNLVYLTRKLWMWCLERNIHIQAQHLQGVLNCVADSESRCMKDRSDWRLDNQSFTKVNNRYGPLEVDLFASRLTKQTICALATSAGGQIHSQKQSMHFSRTGRQYGVLPTLHGTWYPRFWGK